MFTGLVEETGRIGSMDRAGNAMRLTVSCRKVLEGVATGDSIAVNGVCLTVTDFGSDYFSTDVMPETMDKSNLGDLVVGSSVNLERALAAGDRLGGHFVQGHVDGVGHILSRTPDENAVLFRIQVPEELTRWMVDKGSVAVNGISLTIVKAEPEAFTVSIIPHTLEMTQLQEARPGDRVNIECDMIGKYVAKLSAGWIEGKGDGRDESF
ncbi:MAG: riboflavin synthase [Firmicutes bacterium]|uniref:Riboflavin synthase n=1 Tax=Melghirimyces thermohalophilus TaxID=1236220 RepID=A0A1G6LMX8_9BACL|nr:riboflavin synthase [Melghirimyces thermohalophilus]MDA8353798.1 riboflavin synthase [Bacillota bacterium]SDC44600.1 riboflavin synthase alpha chain [Melghirimyces thermohalophilus]